MPRRHPNLPRSLSAPLSVVRTMMVILLNELRAVPFSFTLCTSTRCSQLSMIWKRTKSLSLSFKKGVWSDEGRLPSDDPLHWGKLLSAFFGFWWWFPTKLIERNLRVNLVRRRSNKTRLSLNACRFEICHDRSNWRMCKICASCVKISRKQCAFLQNLRRNKRFAPTKGIPNSYSYISLNYTIRIYLSFVLVYLLQCYL